MVPEMLWEAGKKHAYIDSDAGADPSQGKGIVDGSLFAWRKLTTTHRALDPQLQLTLKLKWNYHLDPKAGKAKIVNHLRCPIFPDNLWTDVPLDVSSTLTKFIPGTTPLIQTISQVRPLATSISALPMEATSPNP